MRRVFLAYAAYHETNRPELLEHEVTVEVSDGQYEHVKVMAKDPVDAINRVRTME